MMGERGPLTGSGADWPIVSQEAIRKKPETLGGTAPQTPRVRAGTVI